MGGSSVMSGGKACYVGALTSKNSGLELLNTIVHCGKYIRLYRGVYVWR